MPTFGSNDRSRWATVRALVDDGTFVIGRAIATSWSSATSVRWGRPMLLEAAVLFEAGYRRGRQRRRLRPPATRGIVFEDGWQTVDKVLQPARWSSTPASRRCCRRWSPANTGCSKHVIGWSLKEQPLEVVRTVLLTINALPWSCTSCCCRGWLERYAAADWGALLRPGRRRLRHAAHALSHHLQQPHDRHRQRRRRRLRRLSRGREGRRPGGISWRACVAGFTVTNELPALALAAVSSRLVLLWRSPRRTLLLYRSRVACAAAAPGLDELSRPGSSATGLQRIRRAVVSSTRGATGARAAARRETPRHRLRPRT